MQKYVEVNIFAKKLTKERVSITIGKQQLDVIIRDEQVCRQCVDRCSMAVCGHVTHASVKREGSSCPVCAWNHESSDIAMHINDHVVEFCAGRAGV